MCEDSTIFLNNQAFRRKIGFLACFSRKLLAYEHFFRHFPLCRGGSQKWIEHRLVRMSKGGLQAVFRLQPAFADILGLFAYRDQVIVFLATLYEQILAVDEVLGCDRTVEGRELLLVKAHAVALDELAHLTLGGRSANPPDRRYQRQVVRAGRGRSYSGARP